MEQWFSSKTKIGRVNRTILQAFIGISASFMIIMGSPAVYEWFGTLPIVVQMGGMAVVVGMVSALQNYGKTLWEKVKNL